MSRENESKHNPQIPLFCIRGHYFDYYGSQLEWWEADKALQKGTHILCTTQEEGRDAKKALVRKDTQTPPVVKLSRGQIEDIIQLYESDPDSFKKLVQAGIDPTSVRRSPGSVFDVLDALTKDRFILKDPVIEENSNGLRGRKRSVNYHTPFSGYEPPEGEITVEKCSLFDRIVGKRGK
ncbi:MAG: hypothetical protein US75_C0026G0013 [Candidatus Woesebacteria bacterium GW2011_GWC1_38_13]|uniref:Uncharacterized protein n=3 Tax=Candidatus Woeseibacteriota TaxID=1752722 RepID=A0A0G0KX16_9BACT|nr:MAG: hypothetical protein US67_C0042G0003 [Candidatus Woesebacteria bacterium GW2011_GWD1_38_10]KKQ55297.1 MAG: hypothetical protein US75_C0026G0013 [Candidatus Woesebacteria bacterium GW2011_GWC1_38_13]KKQ76182.1 MAG: hypothetical protein US97_C0018G0007 [Microgenomates group bacterium GW2011_GWF1_38_5]KKQ84233.1 MAG: hypothetical protein UT06_C0007G0006 [Candidatus Woesebacteria bacterium GW2011_GWA1_38_8]